MRPLPVAGVAMIAASIVIYFAPFFQGMSAAELVDICTVAYAVGGQDAACDAVFSAYAGSAIISIAGVVLLVIGIIRARRRSGL